MGGSITSYDFRPQEVRSISISKWITTNYATNATHAMSYYFVEGCHLSSTDTFEASHNRKSR